jgi:hypothetical protein
MAHYQNVNDFDIDPSFIPDGSPGQARVEKDELARAVSIVECGRQFTIENRLLLDDIRLSV